MSRAWRWRCSCWLIEDDAEQVQVLHVCKEHRQIVAHVLYLMDDGVVLSSNSEGV